MVDTQISRVEHIRYLEMLKIVIISLIYTGNFFMIMNLEISDMITYTIIISFLVSFILTFIQIWLLKILIQRTPKFPLMPLVDSFYMSKSKEQINSMYILILIGITTQLALLLVQCFEKTTIYFEPILIFAGYVFVIIYWGLFLQLPKLSSTLTILGFIWSIIAILRVFLPSVNVLLNDWITTTLFILGFPAAIVGLMQYTIPSDKRRYSL